MPHLAIALLAALVLQAPDTAATRRAVLAADRALARSGAVLDRLEPRAAVLLPGEPVYRGAEAARSAFRARYSTGGARYSWTPLAAVVSADGRLGCTTGGSRLVLPGDSAGVRFGRYLTCWRLDARGAWRIVVHARAGESRADEEPGASGPAWPHSATGAGSDPDQPLVADARFARLALDSGPGPAFARFAAPDGMMLGARPVPPAGPDTIRARFDGFPGDQRLMWTPIRDAGATSGGLGVTVGEAVVAVPGGEPASRSKYVTVWRQEPDGGWRFVFDMGSGRPPGPLDRHFPLLVRLQARLDSLHAAGRFPGATFGAVLPDGSVIGIATGLSDTARRIVMTPDAVMPQGSVGKTYVAALALTLVGEGRLDLDAPIATYLGREPWFSRLPNGGEATVRQLMNHTSGLVRYEFSEQFTADLSGAPPDKVWDPVEEIAYIFDRPAPFRAGAGWQYSDTNYLVLGLIIERITGRPLVAEIQRRVVGPRGLTETIPNLGPVVPGVVQGYAGARNVFGGTDAMLTDGRFHINPQFEWAGGGWSSTARDLARWGKALYEYEVFDSTLASRFLDGVPARLGPGTRYGLGVIIWPDTPLGPAVGHSGFFPGYQSELRYFRSHRLATAFQVNASSGRVLPGGMNAGILELSQVVADTP